MNCIENDQAIPEELKKVINEYDADLLIYVDEIRRENYWSLLEQLRTPPERPNLLMLLSTYGGDPHAGYRIMRMLQNAYKNITLYVPGPCKSAGTLMAMGAHALVMDEGGEFGPLDIQVLKKDEIAEMGSGLDINEALNSLAVQALETFRRVLLDIKIGAGVTTKMAGELAAKLTIGLYAPVFGQIDPIRLGEMQRAISITYDYAKRLRTDNVKSETPLRLVTTYRDHGFAIDRGEACDLFERVGDPQPVLSNLLSYLAYTPESPEQPAHTQFYRCPKGESHDSTPCCSRSEQETFAGDAGTADRSVPGFGTQEAKSP